jgi:ankyrin repeat domain-containing protein 50
VLKSFPSNIEDVYRRTLARISNESRKHASLAKAVLVWVLNASRSMTIEELERAVITFPGSRKFERSRRVPGATLVSLCGGLITVEEESRLVRLVRKFPRDTQFAMSTHQSTDYTAKETLAELLREEFPHPHSLLAAVCMTHLTDHGFRNTTISSEEEFKTVLKSDPLLAYASEAWAYHSQESLHVEETERRTAQFMKDINAFPAFTSLDRTTTFDILTPLHILALYHLPLRLYQEPTNLNAITIIYRQSVLKLASQFGHEELVASLIAFSEVSVNLLDIDGWSALMMAAMFRHEGIVAILLAHPEIQVNLTKKGQGWSALIMAAAYGNEGTVKVLLMDPEIQVNLVDSGGRSALMYAAGFGREGTLELLLACSDIKVNLTDNNESSALMMAARYGQEGTVKLLLVVPEIQVNVIDGDRRRTALMWAACDGHTATVKLLLAHPSIQVNLANRHGSTALLLAAQYGHKDTVEQIVNTGVATINGFDNDRDTPIKIAAQDGHEEIVRLLLAQPNIDTTIRSTMDGHTGMSAALENGHRGIVELLRDFESRRDTFAGHPDVSQLPKTIALDNEESDNADDASACYFDAEETLGERMMFPEC